MVLKVWIHSHVLLLAVGIIQTTTGSRVFSVVLITPFLILHDAASTEICDSSHESHPDRVGTPIQSEDHNHGGFKKISAIEGRLMAKSEPALSLHRDQDKLDTKQAEFDSMLQSFKETQAEIKQTFFIAANHRGHSEKSTGLEWIAREAQEAFVPGSRSTKKGTDFVLFKGLKIGITNVFPHTHEESGRDSVKISTAAKPYTNFMEKMETILLKELEPGNHQKITVEDFSEVGKDILNIKNFLMDPVMVPENEAIVQNHFKRYSFLILDFLQRKLGPDYMEKLD
ncbi:hypothetical protein H4Q26_003568 [Puccinia striiformis f. sp. tritici PST-130]|nr:hypothetical protein H4Q26_003568 [Puccinia striiformis f. sp. tritici PST-130]